MALPAQADSIRLGGAQSATGIPRTTTPFHPRHRLLLAALAGALGCTAALSLAPGTARLAPRTPAADGGLSTLPLAAQGPISELLGRDSASYAVRDLHAVNAAQRLRLAFSTRGVSIATGSAKLDIALSAYGYGDSLHPVASVAPRAGVNRVTYAHGSLTEWYANGPIGLEQGFTVTSRPGAGSGPLTLSLSLSGGLAARLHDGSVLLEGHGAALRYGGLLATDARGRTLRSSLAVVAGHLVIRVDDHGAEYPVRIDPFVQQAVLTQSGTIDGSFSFSTAVSGRTIVVGDPAYEAARGAAYVFEEPASGWTNATETLKLTAEDGKENNFFGGSVAVSGDTIVVGAALDKTTYYPKGAAYIFQTSSNWSTAKQVAQLTVADEREHKPQMLGELPYEEETPEEENFGGSVAISGTTLVVGAPGRNGDQGAAYVFQEPSEGWAHASALAYSAVLHAPTFTEGCPEFGESIALSGATVVVGAPGSYFAGSNCAFHLEGHAYVFVEPGGGWAGELNPTVTLTPSESAVEDEFGSSVALSEAGGTIVVGSPNQTVSANADQGAAYVFQKPAGGWTGSPAQGQLANPSGTAKEEFGHAVAISPDASSLVVAAPGSFEEGRARVSALYVFTTPVGGWGTGTPNSPERLGTPEEEGLGYSLAVSDDAVVAGAPGTALVFGTGLGISISSPANGAIYTPGQQVNAAYACSAPTGATVTRCAGTVADGAAIETNTPGVHNFIVEAEDSAGAKASSLSAYKVASPTTTTEATSTTGTTPTTVTLTPAQKAAAEAAKKARLEKEAVEFAAWIQAVMSNPENAANASKLLNEGGVPVSYKLVPEPGLIATTGSTVTWYKPTGSAARVSSRKKPVMVFKLSYRITKSGKVSFKVPLTSAGRKLLEQEVKAHRSLVVYWTVTFTPLASRPVTETFKVTLKPGHAKKRRK